MTKYFQIIGFCSFLFLSSCVDEVNCGSAPALPEVNEQELASEVAEIESYLQNNDLEFFSGEGNLTFVAIEEGTGIGPTFCDQVTIDYEGRILGSNETFTALIGQNLSMRDNTLLPIFKLALNQMSRGADYRVFIPASLVVSVGISTPKPSNIPVGSNIEFRIRLTNY